jgi:uncharacterized protein YbjT (DUF2867 family)
MPKRKKKTHSFTITVTAPAFLTKAEVAREIRTLINDQCHYLSGKMVATKLDLDWMELGERDIRVKKLTRAA